MSIFVASAEPPPFFIIVEYTTVPRTCTYDIFSVAGLPLPSMPVVACVHLNAAYSRCCYPAH